MNEIVRRQVECDLPALSSILPDLILAKNGDRAANLDNAIQAVSYAIANLRDASKALS